MSGVTGLSDGGFPALYNPSAIHHSMAFLSIGMYYRGTGTYIWSAGGSLNSRSVGLALGMSYVGDAIFKQWGFSFATSLKLRPCRLGIGIEHRASSFLEQIKLTKTMVQLGLHSTEKRPWMVGGYIRSIVFRGTPVIRYILATGYRLHPMMRIYIQGEWEKGYRSIIRFAGSLDINPRCRLRFGFILNALTTSAGITYTAAPVRISFSLAYHAFLGAHTLSAISYEFKPSAAD